MHVARTVEEVRQAVGAWKRQGLSVGLVPTMGYLHEGHESLMHAAGREADKVVVSIFVNPIQFGPNEDLDRYPRNLERDLEICERNKVDLVFHPEPAVMYPETFHTSVEVDALTRGLCGRGRPGHFKGVTTVVCKLFNIVGPDLACFGQKDAQQLAVIRRMVEDLNMPVRIIGCPIVREPDGLAKSSRNAYLAPDERKAALVISKAIRFAEQAVAEGQRNAEAVMQGMKELLGCEPLIQIEYVEIVDAETLEPLETLEGPVLVALAARTCGTRLIDNTVIDLTGS